MDRLTPLFQRFTPQLDVWFASRLLGCCHVPMHPYAGHVHVLLSGAVQIESGGQHAITVAEPSVLLVPRSTPHTLTASPDAQVVCATFECGQRFGNPLTQLQPDVVVVPVSQAPELQGLLPLLQDEASAQRCGKQLALNQLLQFGVLALYRYLIRTEAIPQGMLKALGDTKLLKALTRMHQAPEQAWTLSELAQEAGMSRASFASHFKRSTGTSPMDYLTDWRMSLAQARMASGATVKQVAREVGYDSPAAFTRAFAKKLGQSPTAWARESGSALA